MNPRAHQTSFGLFCLLVCCSIASAQAPRLEYLPQETAARLRNAQTVSIELRQVFSAQDENRASRDIADMALPLAEEVERLCLAVGLKPKAGQADVTLRLSFHGVTRATGYRAAAKPEFFYASASFSAGSSVLLDGNEVQHAAWSHQIIPPDSISDSPRPFTSPSAILPEVGLPDLRNQGLKRVFSYPTTPQAAPFNELLPEFRQGVLTTLAGMRGVDAIIGLLRTEYAEQAGVWLKSARGRAVEPLLAAIENDAPGVRSQAQGLLSEITGQMHPTPAAWRLWWEQNRHAFPPGP